MNNNNLAAAGIKVIKNESIKDCIINNRKETPEHLKKFRKSNLNQIGESLKHYGKLNDELPNKNFTYGKKNQFIDNINDCLKDKNELEGNKLINNIKEEIYQSKRKEPLGQRVKMEIEYPDNIKNENFKFGKATINSENTVKDLLNDNNLLENNKIHDHYKKSHNNYNVGEQKKYNYNQNFDNNKFFGKKLKKENTESIQNCLKQENDNVEDFPKTKIISKNEKLIKDFKYENLGTYKNLGQDENLEFKKKLKEEFHVIDCINGNGYGIDQDKDCIGKTKKYGFRNLTKPGDEDKIFGMPSNKIENKNFHENGKAIELIFPNYFDGYGVNKNDYDIFRSKEEIFSIFINSGFNYNRGKLEGIWLKAVKDLNHKNLCNVNLFLNAAKDLHYIK